VDQLVVPSLRLVVTLIEEFRVKVANSEKLQCKERYEDVPISIQQFQFSTTLYSLPLHGLDVVLGIQWWEKLGLVMCGWKKMTMSFQWGNQTILLGLRL
jgi:hypothetical protein